MQSETPLTSSYEATFESYAELYESMQIPPPPTFLEQNINTSLPYCSLVAQVFSSAQILNRILFSFATFISLASYRLSKKSFASSQLYPAVKYPSINNKVGPKLPTLQIREA